MTECGLDSSGTREGRVVGLERNVESSCYVNYRKVASKRTVSFEIRSANEVSSCGDVHRHQATPSPPPPPPPPPVLQTRKIIFV